MLNQDKDICHFLHTPCCCRPLTATKTFTFSHKKNKMGAKTKNYNDNDDHGCKQKIKASLWCVTDASQGGEAELHDSVDLATPVSLDGGRILLREAAMSGEDPYIVDGLVQFVGSVSIVDGALVTTHSLRFEPSLTLERGCPPALSTRAVVFQQD